MKILEAQPGTNESEHGREPCNLLTHEMLLTADPEMAIVRIFGSDKSANAVRIGLTPERALRIGAAFIRAGLRIKPQLGIDVALGKSDEANLKLIEGKR